jgi:hypothetical protein
MIIDGGHGAIVGWPEANLHTINESGYVDVSKSPERLRGRRLSWFVPPALCQPSRRSARGTQRG